MSQRKYECSNCGAEAGVIRGTYPFRELSLKNVVLQGIELIHCESCGNDDPVIPRMTELMRVLALAVIRKPYRLRGDEVRFLRKYLGMTAEAFSRLIRVDRATLSKWENGEDPVGEQSDLLIRTVVLGLGEGLQEKMQDAIREFPQIRDARRRVRIEVDPVKMEYTYA